MASAGRTLAGASPGLQDRKAVSGAGRAPPLPRTVSGAGRAPPCLAPNFQGRPRQTRNYGGPWGGRLLPSFAPGYNRALVPTFEQTPGRNHGSSPFPRCIHLHLAGPRPRRSIRERSGAGKEGEEEGGRGGRGRRRHRLGRCPAHRDQGGPEAHAPEQGGSLGTGPPPEARPNGRRDGPEAPEAAWALVPRPHGRPGWEPPAGPRAPEERRESRVLERRRDRRRQRVLRAS